jgi:molybdopterin-containing oxidoreductase family membrane subunit
MITLFSFVSAFLIISVLAKFFPVITIWEYAEEQGIDKTYLTEKPKN